MSKICKGDRVIFNSDMGTLHGIITCKRHNLIGVFSPPGSTNFGDYKGWSGTEFFLPDQLEVKTDHSGRPRGMTLYEQA